MDNGIRSMQKYINSNPIEIDNFVSYPASTLHGLILDEPYLWREAQLHPLTYLAPDILGLGLEPLNGHLLPPLVPKHGHVHLAHLRITGIHHHLRKPIVIWARERRVT